MDAIRKQEKSHEISEDEARNLQDEVQKITDQYTAKVEELLSAKEKDITTV
jgi:ribosome recycling factor